jgi:predicted Ser/Thr protein kinase
VTDSSTCPQCSRPVPKDSPGGLCPSCLIAQAVAQPLAATTPRRGTAFAPAVQDLAHLFPHLEILELIGQGGMGAVYKARQTKLDRLVALKIIRPESADDPAFAERFNREAKTLARLNHPGIVGIYDFGDVTLSGGDRGPSTGAEPTDSPLYYFVMEYVDGVNLRELFAEGALPAEQALAIVPQACEAIQYAHEEGVIHRDIKPENILLDMKGRVKIADFGLAKLAARSAEDFTLTATHQVMGTPRYMAPEQMEGSRAVDHRADIYSLGVVFYEMLTGQVPAGHFEPPSRHASVDPRLDDIVLRALARDPARRFQQASEISSQVGALHGLGSGTGRGAAPELNAAWPGPSTILEQGVGRIVRDVRTGGIVRAVAAPATPSVLAILFCLIGLATMLLPWGIRATADSPAVGHPVYAWDNSWGQIAGIVLFVLTLVLFAGTPSGRRPAWRPWTLLICGGLLFGLGALFHDNELKGSSLLPVERLIGGDRTAPPGTEAPRTEAAMRTLPQKSFYAGLALSLGLILVGAWDMRMWLNAPPAPLITDEIRGPRLSRKAVAGAVVGMCGLVVPLLAGAAMSVTVRQPTPDEGRSMVLLVPLLFMGLPVVLAGGGATLLGGLAIIDIRGSAGRLTGLGLAFADAVVFPLLLSYVLLTGLIFLAVNGLTIDPPQSDFVASLVIAALLWLPAAFVITRRMWRRVSGAAGGSDASKEPTLIPAKAQRDSQFGGRDWVVLSREQVDADDLPDVCIVCGRPTLDRVNREFSFQPEWAQLLTFLGMFLFVIPGLVAAELTSRHLRVACPVCPQHRNHWSRFTWWASLGWLIPVLLTGVGVLAGWIVGPNGPESRAVGGFIGAGLGLTAYIVPLVWMATHLVDAEEITDRSIRLRRVSAEFARLAGRRESTRSRSAHQTPPAMS